MIKNSIIDVENLVKEKKGKVSNLLVGTMIELPSCSNGRRDCKIY